MLHLCGSSWIYADEFVKDFKALKSINYSYFQTSAYMLCLITSKPLSTDILMAKMQEIDWVKVDHE